MSVKLIDNSLQKEVEINSLFFSDGTPHINNFHVYISEYTIDLRFDSNNDLLMALALTDYLKRSAAKSITLLCPYFPGARQDRGAPLTAKIYADIINAQNYKYVWILDPHSDVTSALLNNCRL